METKGKKMKVSKRIVLVLSIICIFSVLFMLYALYRTAPKKIESKFIPPGFDESAIKGNPNVADIYGWSEIFQEGMNFKFSITNKIYVDEENQADVYLYSDDGNNVWIKARIFDEKGTVLGESKLIRSGEYIKSVNLCKKVNSGQKVRIKIMSYQPDTYYSEGSVILNSYIEVRASK